MEQIEKEKLELQEWLRGLDFNPSRSIYSQALEALKTYKANAELMSERAHLKVILDDLQYHRTWIEEQIPRALELAESADRLARS